MAATRIYIDYEPKLYSDLIQKVFQNIGHEVIVGTGDAEGDSLQFLLDRMDCNEIMLISLQDIDVPPGDRLTNLMPRATIIAFSPTGEFGYRRLPGKTNWDEIRPFGIAELLDEVLSKGNQVIPKHK